MTQMKSLLATTITSATIVSATLFSVNALAGLPIAGCKDTDFVQGADKNQINSVGKTYSPKCLKIKIGAEVTIDASSHHPLEAMPDIDKAPNPFANAPQFKAPQTRTMNQAGLFGYYCDAHGDQTGKGMAGVIWVE